MTKRNSIARDQQARRRAAAGSKRQEAPDLDKAIARIDTLTATARTSWFGLLSYLAFVGVSLMGVEDADFFIPERQTELPLVGLSIPTFLFFALAPWLGFLLYAYFHLHLMKLWEALAEAPAPEGERRLGDLITPWLVSDYALSFRTDEAVRDRPMIWLAHLAVRILAFFAAPAVLFFFWVWSFPAHSEPLTVIACGLPLALSAYVGLSSWNRMRALTIGTGGLRAFRLPGAGRIFWITFVVSALFGWLKTEGTFDRYARLALGVERFDFFEKGGILLEQFGSTYNEIESARWSRTPFPNLLARADLAFVDFVDTPPTGNTAVSPKRNFAGTGARRRVFRHKPA